MLKGLCLMKSNFSFLPENWNYLGKLATNAENNVYSDPRAAISELRLFCEGLTDGIFHFNRLSLAGSTMNQYEKLNYLSERVNIAPDVIDMLQLIRKIGNKAVHDHKARITPQIAMDTLKKAYLLAVWFMKMYIDHGYQPDSFVEPTNKNKQAALTISELEKRVKELEAQNSVFQQKIQEQEVPAITKAEKQKRKEINQQFAKQNNLNEHDTRMLIDEQLNDVGWETDTDKYNYFLHKTMPQKGKRMAIAEWPCENNKRADYALFDNCKLVGIIEAKRYNQDIPGALFQAKEYSKTVRIFDGITLPNQSGEYKVPFIYAANGRKYIKQLKEKSGIWFWDARKPFQDSYALAGWHSPADLRKYLTHDLDEADKKLQKENDYPEFANREYQINAIKAVENGLINHKRRMLIAMATGTGKTRTALSLIYRLLSKKRAQRILYLVDRISLAEQTKDAFCNVKVDNKELNKIYNVKGAHEGPIENETRVHITTIQSMIKKVLFNQNQAEAPSVGDYDFIIVDEAHRGYTEDREMTEEELTFANEDNYVSQYRRVLDYFDAPALGLTATPALQTTEIFGDPIYTYSYSDAVVDGYLVDYNPPYQIKTKLSENGIQFKKNDEISLFDAESKEVDKIHLSDDLNFDVTDFNRKVITRSFNETVAQYLASAIDPNYDEGKTLIFAATDSHADMVVELLKKAYKDAGNPVHDDAIMKITGSIRNPEEAIRYFKNEKYPNIVVTVDLLTTGIDVPKIANLVFLRRVRSRILYDQMLGRATRLCPEINKDSFNIYDAVHLYDDLQSITDMKPVVKNKKSNVHDLIEKADTAISDEEFDFYKKEIIAKMQRRKQRMSDDKLAKVAELNEVESVDQWLHELKEMDKTDFIAQSKNIEQMFNVRTQSNYQLISEEADEYLTTERGYGENNEKPGDYLESFTQFINENVDKIDALQVAVNHPSDLTRADLREILRQLERNGYNTKYLQAAWKSVKNEDVITDIISFIRQVAKGIPLQDNEVRIRQAMQKVYDMQDWTPAQMNWLKRIEKQLKNNDAPVLGPNAKEAFDGGAFKDFGGYKRMKGIFKDQVENIILIINKELYKVS